MKCFMRVPIILLLTALALPHGYAESLSDADRETLLDNLDKIRETADSKIDAKYRVAIAAYRNAVGSDDAAIDLYLNCMERVNFEEQKKKPADFREWKRKEAEKLSDPGLRLALRHQLRWLILTLQAASEKSDRGAMAAEAQGIVDSIFRDVEKLKNQEGLLGQGVTSTVFARAYEINQVKIENWPLSPVQLDGVYEEILLPPFRNSARLSQLRDTWGKRIRQEMSKKEFWGDNRRDGQGESKRIGTLESMQSPEYTKFLEEGVPRLQWKMEVDLFRCGDESGAAVRMLAHLQKYLAHPSAREWGDEFRALLKAPANRKTVGESAP
jgi:hypothetical protein